ncbi:sulfite exporter TauE/SafE family protein [bacterium]|nr:sulfite exporter TauE/SafE family protein [bacterium]
MQEWMKLFLLFGLGSIAGFINVNAGGGSSLTLPMLIFLGLDGAMANGTNRVAIAIQNVFAVASFKKHKLSDFKLSSKLALFTLPGAIAGAILAVKLPHGWFQKILGIIMIVIVISMIFNSSKKASSWGENEKPSFWLYPALIGIGFYGGFIQVGVGFLLMAALYHLLRINLIKVNMNKVLIVLIYTVPALIIFMINGKVNWLYGLILAGGNALGAWWGAHAAVKGGEKIIRIVLIIAILIMAVKLLGVF